MSTRSTRSSRSTTPKSSAGNTPNSKGSATKRKRPREQTKSQITPVAEEEPIAAASSDLDLSLLITPQKDSRPIGSSPPFSRRRTGEVESTISPPVAVTSPENDISSPLAYPQQAQSGLVRAIRDLDISSPLSYFGIGELGNTPGSTRSASGMPFTPVRPRGDIKSDKKVRTVTIGEGNSQADITAGEEIAQIQSVIWGTDVNIQETKDTFRLFLTTYIHSPSQKLQDRDGVVLEEVLGRDKPHYLQKLEEIQTLEEPFLDINCDHLSSFSPEFFAQLVRYPQEVIPSMDLAVNELFFQYYPGTELEHQIQVRPFNIDKTKSMRLLNPEDIDQLITISGMIIRLSAILPEMRQAYFECNLCQKGLTADVDRGHIAEPSVCPACQSLYSMQLIHNRSLFSDKQMLKLQESPDDMPAGHTPHSVTLYAHNDLVDSVQPGDKVSVTGIYRASPLRINPRVRTIKAVYRTYIDVIHFRRKDQKRLREVVDIAEGSDKQAGLGMSSERVAELQHLSQSPDIYERLSRALAPSIYEHQDIKKGILLQLFGGTKKDDFFKEAGRSHFRSDINILLCGDPGTSKSQLLQYVHQLMPRSQYTSGKGSSAVGLTAYVTKDPETRQLVLQTGALALSDNGVCCIDEFDKMTDSTRSVLHEVMEQQTLSIAKAGIICSINARASILAAANPKMSTWDSKLTIIENIQLPHTLISRFDLIFLMLDPQDELFDRRLAQHLVSLYNSAEKDYNLSQDMDMQILRDYIAYAKNFIHPKLNEEAGQTLVQAYVDMRKVGSSKGSVTAYPRQLEALIRIAESHAKIRFSQNVEVLDVEEAKRLHREALKQSAMDPKTGIIDVSILTTGISASERNRKAELAKEIYKMLQKLEGKVHAIAKLLVQFLEQSQKQVTERQFEDALKFLSEEEKLMIVGKQIRLS